MSYSANDLTTLSPGRAFREKIGMYLSADRQEAINLGLRELIVNVQDEFEVYKPENPYLKIELFTTERKIRVSDNMRGIPCAVRDDGINSLTAAFLLPHSGAKHKEGSYVSSVGINGEGNKVVCHTAKWLEVEVHRDGNIYFQRFESSEEGAKPVCEVKTSKATDTTTGTIITYEPDERVYGNIFIDENSLKKMLREMSYFTKGLKIILIIDGNSEVFFSKNGLIDGLKNEQAISKPFNYFYSDSDCQVELALQWVAKKGNIRGYANGLYMPDGGAFISSFKTSLTRTFNSLAKTKFLGEQIRDCLEGFVSVKVHVGQFSNQAKTALANKEAGTATSFAISNCLKEFYSHHRTEFNNVIELLTKIEKAEKAAEKTRQAILSHEKEQKINEKKKLLNFDKLRDARKLGKDSILLCVEGNSAGGSMSIGRDPNKYGVLMFRGKAKNLLKATIEEGLANEEVKLLLQALGLTYGRPYNANKLRYGKIALAVDSDFDGSHIGLLLMAMLQVLAPEFLKENRLFWLRAPTCKVETPKKTYFYYSEEEFKNHPKGNITFFKGLGQMNDNDLKASMFNEEWQHLEPITYSEEGINTLISLMSEDVEPRKEFVYNNIDFSKFEVE